MVGGIPTPLKNMKVSWDYYSLFFGKNVPNHQPVSRFPIVFQCTAGGVAKLRIASIACGLLQGFATPCKKNCNGDQAAEAFTEGFYMGSSIVNKYDIYNFTYI